MVHHARHGAVEFARLHCLLGGAGHTLLPLDVECLRLIRGEWRRLSGFA